MLQTSFGRRSADRMCAAYRGLPYEGEPDALDQLLRQARELPFKSPTLLRALRLFDEPLTSHRAAYAAFLDHTLRVAVDFDRLLTRFKAVPVEVEMKSIFREAWAFIQPGSRASAENWSVVFFEIDGVRFEREVASDVEALNVMVDEGYVVPDPNALCRVSSGAGWLGGVQSTGVMANEERRAETAEHVPS